MPWVEGEALTPTNLNAHATSAQSVAGFSTNTITPESGNTVTVRAALSTNTLSPESGNTIVVTGAPGTLSIFSDGGVIIPRRLLVGDDPFLPDNTTPFFETGVNVQPDSGAFGTFTNNNAIYVSASFTTYATSEIHCIRINQGGPSGITTANIFGVRVGLSKGAGATVSGILAGLYSSVDAGSNHFALYTETGKVRINDTSLFTTGTALAPSLAFSSETSLGLYRSGTSTVALSYGTLNLNQSRLVSARTAASLDSTSMVANEMAFAITSSGASLAIRSGSTIYYFTSSASTKA